jgi:hypothetical protein
MTTISEQATVMGKTKAEEKMISMKREAHAKAVKQAMIRTLIINSF